MRDFGIFVSVIALLLSANAPLAAAQAAPARAIGSTALNPSQTQISGRALTPDGHPLSNATVRARNLLTGHIDASTSTTSAGEFSITISPGSYMLEVVDAEGRLVATSSFISAAAGSAITGVTLTTTTEVVASATTTAGLGSRIARSVTYAAAAAGVAGVVTRATTITASPSR